MKIEELTINAVLDTIPQLYKASSGPDQCEVSFELGNQKEVRYTHIPLTPDLNEYLLSCQGALEEFPFSKSVQSNLETMRVQDLCASIWLNIRTGFNNWNLVFDYFSKLQMRTIENLPVVKTIVIDRGESPSKSQLKIPLDSLEHSKITDWLGSSSNSFLKVSEELDIIELKHLNHSEVDDPSTYQLLPAFIYPIASTLKNYSQKDPKARKRDEILVCLNQRGDLIITNKNELLATKRKGRWMIYDSRTFKNSINHCIGLSTFGEDKSYGIAATFFQVLFDMSFKRHGGLLLLTGDESLILNHTTGGIRANDSNNLLSHLLPKKSFSTLSPELSDLRCLVEFTSLDGAILFNKNGNVLGAGVMIKTNESSSQGARTAAAKAAVGYGFAALKVSSDGDISIFFKTPKYTENVIHEMRFL